MTQRSTPTTLPPQVQEPTAHSLYASAWNNPQTSKLGAGKEQPIAERRGAMDDLLRLKPRRTMKRGGHAVARALNFFIVIIVVMSPDFCRFPWRAGVMMHQTQGTSSCPDWNQSFGYTSVPWDSIPPWSSTAPSCGASMWGS